ncbi:glycogen debranching N-terminal domain-containing protein [Phytohabitans sp. ZYX-F-186]|uniref:Glycogen debranching N-terminal domain-containing protein n=1 Tax=Phytohabitans maris TaxID=3071409 RepID=A0ABU0ZM45_9ACTN|nr:glycogen debranching N-terminal domain-containing protein [Phytohabitans sp. ZYX-F-186]MDQ7907340.1 glycogen debranching N-terminal domain-containing protein [Phytohabitans sp. ZYX-F-186]
MPDHKLQPLLHDLVTTTAAPTTVLSAAGGQVSGAGVQGVFHADARALAEARLLVDGREPEPIGHTPAGPGATRFVSVVRWLGTRIADPTVRIDRLRQVTPGGMAEEITVTSAADVPVHATVTLDLACDLAPIEVVKSGGTAPRLTPVEPLVWHAGGITVTVTGPPAGVDRLAWPVDLPTRGSTTLRWQVRIDDPRAMVAAPEGPVEWARPEVTADDHRLVRLLDRSLDDLAALRLTDGDDTYLGAGVPWFLTLFGRDSIWAARMLLPLGTELAAGTLRVLARRQGTREDGRSGEAPGKIMHELRRQDSRHQGELMELPAAYYGTVDATPLWVSLLHDAWRWGMPPQEVAALLPHVEAALSWLGGHTDFGGRADFVRYIDESGRGLANQGWKDSGDAVRFRDGRHAEPPIALAEVQGYAYQAALHGAALLDAFDRPGADRWRDYAGALAERFRARYWVDGPQGTYPALALDRHGRPVDALTSNIGHLLGTGLLTAKESTAVAEALASPALSGGYGLRTMSTQDAGFSPLSYHCGSIWAHDTAIVLAGLAREGFGPAAAKLADGLLTAGEAFDYRLPELYGGDDRTDFARPMPYPAACRPQAWSAAAAVVVLHAALGIYPDVPAGRVTLRPSLPLGAVRARGLRVAGSPVDAAVDAAGHARLTGLPTGLTLRETP